MPGSPRAARRLHIIVIDDDRLIGELVHDVLSEHDVTVEADPVHAIARFSGGERFDLVLCDLHMPALDGPGVLEALTTAQPDARRRFVYLTGGAVGPRDRLALVSAPGGYLEKPFDAAALRRVVAERAPPPSGRRPGSAR